MFRVRSFFGLGLVVPAGVDGEFVDEFAGDGVDDVDVQVVDEHEDAGSGVGSAHSDVVQFSVDAEGEFSVFVDAVVSDSVVRVAAAVGAGNGFRAGDVGRGGGGAVR